MSGDTQPPADATGEDRKLAAASQGDAGLHLEKRVFNLAMDCWQDIKSGKVHSTSKAHLLIIAAYGDNRVASATARLRAELEAELRRVAEAGAEALMIASAVFTVWGDKFAQETVEDFRVKERSFLALAAQSPDAKEDGKPTAPASADERSEGE